MLNNKDRFFSAAGNLFVAIPGFDGRDVTLSATVNGKL